MDEEETPQWNEEFYGHAFHQFYTKDPSVCARLLCA